MIVNECKNRKLVGICFNTEHYLANLFATNRILGIPLKDATVMCKKCTPGVPLQITKPLPIVSDLNMDELFDELDEYSITISVTVK